MCFSQIALDRLQPRDQRPRARYPIAAPPGRPAERPPSEADLRSTMLDSDTRLCRFRTDAFAVSVAERRRDTAGLAPQLLGRTPCRRVRRPSSAACSASTSSSCARWRGPSTLELAGCLRRRSRGCRMCAAGRGSGGGVDVLGRACVGNAWRARAIEMAARGPGEDEIVVVGEDLPRQGFPHE
jgi:hypothetical protein